MTTTDTHTLERGTIDTGIAMGSLVLLLPMAAQSPWGFGLAFTAYVAAITWIALRTRRVTQPPAGYALLHSLGILGTTALYAWAVVLNSTGTLTWELAVPLAIATMTPAMLAGHRISRLS